MSKWAIAKLGTILRRSEEIVTPQTDAEYSEITVRLWGKGVIERGLICGATLTGRRFIARAGQFIVSRIDARNGAMGLIPQCLEGALVTNDFPLFDIDTTQMERAFLGWLCRTADFVELCRQASEGTTNRVRLKEERFHDIEIPLPPLSEQRRIVARIEELAAQINEAKGLKEYAFTNAEVLFTATLQKMRYNLLNSKFLCSRLGELATVTSGSTPSRDVPMFWNGSIPWIKSGELLDSDISSAGECITQFALDSSKTKLFPKNTVLIALYGQGQTRGRTGRLLIPATTNQACCAILPKPDLFDSRYIQFWLRSFYAELREVAHGGAQPNWNTATIKNLPFVIPPLPEQRCIMADLDALQAEIDTLRNVQSETVAELNALLPAVLDRAFKGEL